MHAGDRYEKKSRRGREFELISIRKEVVGLCTDSGVRSARCVLGGGGGEFCGGGVGGGVVSKTLGVQLFLLSSLTAFIWWIWAFGVLVIQSFWLSNFLLWYWYISSSVTWCRRSVKTLKAVSNL